MKMEVVPVLWILYKLQDIRDIGLITDYRRLSEFEDRIRKQLFIWEQEENIRMHAPPEYIEQSPQWRALL